MANVLWIAVVDSATRPVAQARVEVTDARGHSIATILVDGRWQSDGFAGAVTIRAEAPGYSPETLGTTPRGVVTNATLGLRRSGEASYRRGDSRLAFRPQPGRKAASTGLSTALSGCGGSAMVLRDPASGVLGAPRTQGRSND